MMPFLDMFLRLLLVIFGLWLVYFTIMTTIRVFVLPRGENAWLARQIFRVMYNLFIMRARKAESYSERDRVLALFGPIVLLVQPLIYLALLVLGFTCVYWAINPDPLSFYSYEEALFLSGSSLMTLGFASVDSHDIVTMSLSFTQAALGMIFVALLIAYLPTIYSAFSKREMLVGLLEVRAGQPPSGATMIERVYRNNGGPEQLDDTWTRWEEWFAQIEESHTSLVALVFFRSPMPDRHWVTAAGAVMDAAALLDSTVDAPRNVRSVLALRAGYVSLRRIADYFGNTIVYNPSPSPDDPISISREEFDEVYDELKANDVPVIADREAAWRNYAGWRVNYDRVLLGLARLTSAPYAPWSSDRTIPDMRNIPGITPFDHFDYRPKYETTS